MTEYAYKRKMFRVLIFRIRPNRAEMEKNV